jgi:hypothetical protein
MRKKAARGALAILLAGLALDAPADQVTYWFSGLVTSVQNPSNAMPFNVSVGTPFAARLSYDASLIGYSNVNSYPDGEVGFYYFTNTAGYSMVFQIAGHTITNISRPGVFCGQVGIYDQYNNEDSYWSETGAGRTLTLDGSPYLSAPYFSVISVYLDDDSKSTFTSVAIPTNAPVLSSFGSHRDLTWGAYIDDGGPTRLFSVSGVFTDISLIEQVLLNYRVLAANAVQLHWPVTVSGFTLQSSTDLSVNNWQAVTNGVLDINGEHTVTVTPDHPARCFRLIK